MEKRKRRSFSKEYKAEVVALIRKGGKSIGAVASDLDLSETAVRRWVSQAEIDSGGGPSGALTTAERVEPGSAAVAQRQELGVTPSQTVEVPESIKELL